MKLTLNHQKPRKLSDYEKRENELLSQTKWKGLVTPNLLRYALERCGYVSKVWASLAEKEGIPQNTEPVVRYLKESPLTIYYHILLWNIRTPGTLEELPPNGMDVQKYLDDRFNDDPQGWKLRVKHSTCLRECLAFFDLWDDNSVHNILVANIRKRKIDTSHWDDLEAELKFRSILRNTNFSIVDAKENSDKRKKRNSFLGENLRRWKMVPPTCEICGRPPIHEGQRTQFEIHHKDSDPKNNTLGNLQNLCRQCHGDTLDHSRQKTVAQVSPEEAMKAFIDHNEDVGPTRHFLGITESVLQSLLTKYREVAEYKTAVANAVYTMQALVRRKGIEVAIKRLKRPRWFIEQQLGFFTKEELPMDMVQLDEGLSVIHAGDGTVFGNVRSGDLKDMIYRLIEAEDTGQLDLEGTVLAPLLQKEADASKIVKAQQSACPVITTDELNGDFPEYSYEVAPHTKAEQLDQLRRIAFEITEGQSQPNRKNFTKTWADYVDSGNAPPYAVKSLDKYFKEEGWEGWPWFFGVPNAYPGPGIYSFPLNPTSEYMENSKRNIEVYGWTKVCETLGVHGDTLKNFLTQNGIDPSSIQSRLVTRKRRTVTKEVTETEEEVTYEPPPFDLFKDTI